MDLLHSGKLNGFCIASSDGDFTCLTARVREESLAVYGFGEQKTPKSFVSACDRFIYTEILRQAAPKATTPAEKPKPPVALPKEAVETSADDEGWAYFGLRRGRATDFQNRARFRPAHLWPHQTWRIGRLDRPGHSNSTARARTAVRLCCACASSSDARAI